MVWAIKLKYYIVVLGLLAFIILIPFTFQTICSICLVFVIFFNTQIIVFFFLIFYYFVDLWETKEWKVTIDFSWKYYRVFKEIDWIEICGGVAYYDIRIVGLAPPINLCVVLGIATMGGPKRNLAGRC